MKRSGSPGHSARHAQHLSTLLRAWQESVPSEEWRRLDHRVLRADAAALLEFGSRRRPTQTLLRVACAPANGETGYSLVQLVTEDMPFLVDTLSMTLAQAGVSPHIIIHPILRVQRDAAGRIRSVDQDLNAEGGQQESWQYLRIDRVGDPAEC
jgi:glutamate dehydrogenase